MEEEVNQRVATMIVSTSKMKFKDLMAQNVGTEDPPIKEYNIRTFDKDWL